ncbi:hypothetical protein DDZ13_15060 [Coraliomargarita sinensis]|uniref:Uncharacterized protein n=1 Tax=Coraliomargarita sinensis TaxID=2174842 RepID=A0A317ZCI1_9BACT|nr:hypothetical protein [Coraliomargarita sinensis]PXA02845.1 hypothetical protein DDZ13_15060 [Coraliomargarita sinensis]
MKKKFTILAFILVCIAAYEISFRYWTGKNGEVNTDVSPPSLYYSSDLNSEFPLAERIFTWRANLPLGKVQLAEGTGAYVSGGEFYRKKSDGSWENLSELFAQHSKQSVNQPE